jgi:predicted amidophosphoribosyltransferase
MEVNIRQHSGPWNLGYSLDKHSVRSICIGNNEFGYPIFDTLRTEIGESLYQLKYRFDMSQVDTIANQMVYSLGNYFGNASFIIPMPPSKIRSVQPVVEIAKQVALLMHIPCREDILIKTTHTDQMKDIPLREDRIKALCSSFKINDMLPDGNYDVLLVDDLFDTGSTLEAATIMLQSYSKIRKIFVATVTRKYQ